MAAVEVVKKKQHRERGTLLFRTSETRFHRRHCTVYSICPIERTPWRGQREA